MTEPSKPPSDSLSLPIQDNETGGTPLGPAEVPRVWNIAGKALLWLSLLILFAPPFIFADDTYRLGLFSRYMALALLALSVDLIWGYTGLLSLGQGVYFGLGAYCVAYSLKLQEAAAKADAVPGTVPPDFMSYTNLPITHPDYVTPPALAWIAPLSNIWVALAAAIILPTLFAALFGGITFRMRIRGVYFALITQALLLAVFTLVQNQQPITGGVVGIKNLADLQLFGVTFNPYKKHVHKLYFLVASVVVVCFLGCILLVRSKFGKILTAIRDNENRVLALGYNTAMYKTFVFALAGGLAGLSGALFVGTEQQCGTEYLSITFSIDIVILVAVGGRGTLVGAIVGAILVLFAKTYISNAVPTLWPVILGGLFVGVVLLMPEGIVGLLRRGANLVKQRLWGNKQQAA